MQLTGVQLVRGRYQGDVGETPNRKEKQLYLAVGVRSLSRSYVTLASVLLLSSGYQAHINEI